MRKECIYIVVGLAALVAARPARAQFTALDWLVHRGGNPQTGANNDPGIPGQTLGQAWVFPTPADMPAEIVVDNSTLPAPGVPPVNNQGFTLTGAWTYPTPSERAAGLWPFSDVDPNKVGDYVYKSARFSQALADIGIDTLSALPNLGADIPDPNTGTNTYKKIQDVLTTGTITYARWYFGRIYPNGSRQGTLDASGKPLQANQRYAIYIRFPSSSTLQSAGSGSLARPMTDHVLVRVSWGANPDDPATSRIFMLNSGQTGDYWVRIRSGANDDRFFPYNGTNPLVVTLYDQTPDRVPNTANVVPTIVADSVRLVPESGRGEIHGPAASAIFPPGGGPGAVRRTYFGRDETTGPSNLFPTLLNAAANQIGGFPTILYDPSKGPQPNSALANYNPYIADVSSSIRSAVFYCMEDDEANQRYGRMVWRHVARTPVVTTFTIDDLDPAPAITFTPFAGIPSGFQQITPAVTDPDQPHRTTYLTSPAQATVPPPTTSVDPIPPNVTWRQKLQLGTPHSIFVWIPGGNPASSAFATQAFYRITTSSGLQDIILNQQNTIAGSPRLGSWRRLASGVRFPEVGGGQDATVTLYNYSPTDAAAGRVVAADAIQFVPESQSRNSVVAAPLIVANVRWPNASQRHVVYFATTDGHVWALDALGNHTTANPSTLTTAYWVYPSISNPNSSQKPVGLSFEDQYDPNFIADPGFNNRPTQGIDADLIDTVVPRPGFPGQTMIIKVPGNKAPDLGAFISSPIYVEVETGNPPAVVRKPMIVIGNQNGRVYAFDPAGRANTDPGQGIVGGPYALTLSAGDNPGVPGTTRRIMTWPSTARDKWLKQGGLSLGANSFSTFTSDPNKVYFTSTPSALMEDANFKADRIVAGAGDGHVYCVDLQTLDTTERISNPNNAGAPRWQYPAATTQVDAISLTGTLTTTNKYVFSAGGRVYAVDTPASAANGVATLQWVYPFTSAPPSNPNPGDQLRSPRPYTAPVWRASVSGLNGGNEIVYVANQDGSVTALDASAGPNANPAVVWQSISYGDTHASATFLRHLEPMTGILGAAGPAILLPLDSGELVGIHAVNNGNLTWDMVDGAAGFVPVTDSDGNLIAMPTFNVFRGAEAITANGWVYQGDEGNPNTGEMHGQMRAYANSATVGTSTPGLPPAGQRDQGTLDMRLVELWDSKRDDPTANPAKVWEDLGNTKSPYKEWVNGMAKPNTQGNFIIYEWGDTIYVAAWGTYTGTVLPRVEFRLSSGGSARQTIFVTAKHDPDPPGGLTPGVNPWVATYQAALGRGSANDAQTPGLQYNVVVRAQLTTPGGSVYTTPRMEPGQRTVTTNDPNPAQQYSEINLLGAARPTALAHPLAITTRGVPGGTPVGPNFPNIMGWTSNIPLNNANADLTEALGNGLDVTALQGNAFVRSTQKDIAAPIGMGSHGKTAAYTGIALDNSGNPIQVPALLVADRSNLWKQNQPLNNVRIDRHELRWNYNRALADPLRIATGDAMNPLPFDDFPLDPAFRFPKNTPNTSLDYPDIDRSRAQFRASGVDMSTRGVILPLAGRNQQGNKVLQPQTLDLFVDIPTFQPANVSRVYTDVMGRPSAGFYGPMYNATGANVLSSPNQQVRQMVSPAGGFLGSFSVFIDNNNNGRYDGDIPVAGAQQVTSGASREEVYRSLNVGIGVAPDMALRCEEETIDLGKAAHSLGYAPAIPFAPSFVGPYAAGLSPFDTPGLNPYFVPFTVQNRGNVNLTNLRISKRSGNGDPNLGVVTTNVPAFWTRLVSDQVANLPIDNVGDPGKIWGPRIDTAAILGGPAAGVVGIISSLDHGRGPAHNIFDLESNYGGQPFWPFLLAHPAFPGGNPYIANNNISGWPQGINPMPTLHKARPGDAIPTVLSMPDVAYGDPLNVLATLRATGRETRPSIGLAVPLGTPAGTYTSLIYPFEDHTPIQWREWQSEYQNLVGGGPAPTNFASDGDGVLNLQMNAANNLPVGPPVEPTVTNPFRLKVTVQEARLTNGVSAPIGVSFLQEDRTYPQIDLRPFVPNAGAIPPFGANLQPVAMRDSSPNHANLPIVLFWTTNRPDNNGPTPQIQDTPWTLRQSQLNGIGQLPNAQFPLGLFDWRYEPIDGQLSRWWNPLGPTAQFPPLAQANNLFPSQTTDVVGNPNTQLVPGLIVTNQAGEPMVRHATPALAQNEAPVPDKTMWLYWQGAANKNSGMGATSFSLDSRTFYAPLTWNAGTGQHVPDLSGNAGVPYSFLNDPALPKYGPKPLIFTGLNNQTTHMLFWYGGGRGRTRLYFNHNSGNVADPTVWSRDAALNTPGTLQYQADPSPSYRRVYSTFLNPAGEILDAVDVTYTGLLPHRKQPEVFMTRYGLERGQNGQFNGRLSVLPLTEIENELLAREGASQVWSARDIAWQYRNPQTRAMVDGTGNSPYVRIFVNNVRVNLGSPTFDEATNKLYFNSTLGGQIVVDPQAGTATFTGVAPRSTDRVTASYVPQTMRLNATHNDSGVIAPPAGWAGDATFRSQAHVNSPGANAGPVGFIDRTLNPRMQNVIPGPQGSPSPTVSRMWTLFRKTGTNVTGNGAIYYKTMRLMVRLPRTVIRDLLANGTYTVGNHVRISGNRGPVEVDWTRGRLYFTEIDEGSVVTVEFDYARDNNGGVLTVPPTQYRVTWGDEISAAINPGDQSIGEAALPTETQVNEGQISAFKDPFQDKVWIFWSSTRAGTTDLYYMTISPNFYPLSGSP